MIRSYKRPDICQGTDKLEKVKEVAAKHAVTVVEIAYTGDDLECIRYCEIAACLADVV